MRVRNSLLISIVFFLFSLNAVGQVPMTMADAQAQLAARGITPAELQTKLNEKGVDLTFLDPTDPAQVAQAQQMIEQAIAEIEMEKAVKKENVAQPTEVIKEDLNEAIKDEPAIVAPPLTIDALENKNEILQAETEDIQEAVEDGATIEEAISEEISEELASALPKAVTWGQQIFRDKKISTYQKSRDVKPPESYVLGPGDKIGISIFGYSQENLIFEINDDGYIKPEAMPRITLKGITYGQAKKLLLSRFANFYRFRPEEFEVTLNFSRTITVNIVGEVYNYGSFTLPARNTAFNALAASGGPTNIGSVRNIKLIRAGEKPKNIDIYLFILNPSAEDNLFLQENDYVHVPMAEKVITITGRRKEAFSI